MNTFENMVLEVLKKYCGGMCMINPDNCECFGPLTDEQLKDLVLADSADWEPFYKKENCAFYDAMQFDIKQSLSQSEAIH